MYIWRSISIGNERKQNFLQVFTPGWRNRFLPPDRNIAYGGKSPETLDIVCFWFYNRTRRTRCIVEHVHRVASRTSPNLFSVFCVCNGHRKRGKKRTQRSREYLIKQQQFLFSIPQLEPALNSDFGEVCLIYLSPREFVAVIPRKQSLRICLCTGWTCLEQ